MKFPITCMECQKENGIPSCEFKKLELTNEFYFPFTCSKGHKSITILQNERFEILFDFAYEAYINNYYRESVFNAASAIERFHEFFIKVITLKNLNGISNCSQIVDKTWKELSRQSERQLGAFYMIYLNEFKEVPEKIKGNNIEFRNKVVHKGFIPNKDETHRYLEFAYGYIQKLIRLLKENYSEYITALTK